MTRQVVLDTETTGLDPKQGHRIIEIGCVELVDRRLTGNHYHQYLQPDRLIDDGAQEVHGITNAFLDDKPRFADMVEELLGFIQGAELVIHNAPFDVGFLDQELTWLDAGYGSINDYCSVLDTLVLARKCHAGQNNSLDALCRRYGVDNTQRQLHGVLLDAEILADVFLAITGGQASLLLESERAAERVHQPSRQLDSQRPPLRVVRASADEVAAHEQQLNAIEAAGGVCLWRQTRPGS